MVCCWSQIQIGPIWRKKYKILYYHWTNAHTVPGKQQKQQFSPLRKQLVRVGIRIISSCALNLPAALQGDNLHTCVYLYLDKWVPGVRFGDEHPFNLVPGPGSSVGATVRKGLETIEFRKKVTDQEYLY